VRSARPEDLPRRRARRPLAVAVPSLGLRVPVVPVGVRGRSREVAVPDGTRRVGWYRFGAGPGEPGVTVLAGHVDWNGRPGPFLRLERLEPGRRVRLRVRGGRTLSYRVIARRSYRKERLPRRLFARDGRAALALVTCGGPYDRSTRTYARNTVVWAVRARGSRG
jgi:sortase (surface protein transpeptidase)